MKKFTKILKTIGKVVIIIIIVIAMIALGIFGAISYLNWKQDQKETIDEHGNVVPVEGIELEDNVTCLFMGVNGPLTDFIMLGQYNPNTREVSLLSIPRDTHVEGTVDGKINSAYSGINPLRTVNKVAEVTGITAEYYVLFDTKILRELVNELGGVEVNVPINMNYDDPEQNLYIHLTKGVQTLSGSQAEQFVRFRKNNDGTGYQNGDIGRIAAQQQFIKATISTILEPGNIVKISKLIEVVLNGTKTNITWNIAKTYIDDIATFKTDRITIDTLPGAGGYAENGLSYFFVDEKAAKELVNKMFLKETTVEDVMANTNSNEENTKIKVEVLNAGTTTSIFNTVVETLKENGYEVSKVGNHESSQMQYSRIINYKGNETDLGNLKKLLGIKKTEDNINTPGVAFTIILGPQYELE